MYIYSSKESDIIGTRSSPLMKGLKHVKLHLIGSSLFDEPTPVGPEPHIVGTT